MKQPLKKRNGIGGVIMNFKEYLLSVGLSEEQATKTIEGMDEQNLYLASEENLDIRYEKLKDKHEQLEADLTTANETLTTLKKENQDVEGLQTQIQEYEQSIEKLKTERADEQKTFAIKEALTKQGVSDVDYMMFKLGEVEADEEGNLVELDNRLKELREKYPTHFTDATPPPAGTTDKGGFRILDNKLDDGDTIKTYSMAELSNLSPEEINQNWDAVSASLEKGN